MKYRAVLSAAILLMSCSFLPGQTIRKASYAGLFYPDNPQTLALQIRSFIETASPLISVKKNIRALIVPHAGYLFSGPTAGRAYREVQGKYYETVIILAPSHQVAFEGLSIWPRGAYETPLGSIPIDEETADLLTRLTGATYLPEAHQKEHAVEVQLPFIQISLPGVRIVPVVMGLPDKAVIEGLASALQTAARSRSILVIASSDMSHYLNRETARNRDSKTIVMIKKFRIDDLIKSQRLRKNTMCGGIPVAAALSYARLEGNAEVHELGYADSSEFNGDANRVVGYFSAAVTIPEPEPSFSLSEEEKSDLLKLARRSVRSAVTENRLPEYESRNPRFLSPRSVFVTLKKKGRLRGCIGFTEPLFPLFEAVIRAASYAATRDPRFPAVTRQELDSLSFEISVLSPLRRIQDPRSIEVGRHGLVVMQGQRKGLLLPQVPIEMHWSRETFIEQTCLKAGLPADAWKGNAELYVFEALVFH